MDIKIGSDEIILWLRKNGKAKTCQNSGTGGLGQKIYDLICTKCSGKKVQDNYPSYWPVILDDKIGELELPQTSAQYIININNLHVLFFNLSKW